MQIWLVMIYRRLRHLIRGKDVDLKLVPLKKKKKKLIDLAHQALTNTDDDECAVAGKRIGYQLKGMAEQQTFIAEKLISGIMYYGRVGKLKEDASVLCGGFIPSSHLTSNLYHPPNYLTRMGHPSFPTSSMFVQPHQSQMGRHHSVTTFASRKPGIIPTNCHQFANFCHH
jgi:hypothetical protein